MNGEGNFFEHLAMILNPQPPPSPAACTPTSRSTIWLSSGNPLNYQNFDLRMPTRGPAMGRKTIREELSNSASYRSFYQVSADPPQPIPTLAQFRNEFADIGVDNQNILPPPAPPLPPKTLGMAQLKHCQFCKKNGEHAIQYMSHQLFDQKEIVCPVLRTFNCANCGKMGHTR